MIEPMRTRRFRRLVPARSRGAQTSLGSSLAADLMLIRVFGVVDVAVSFDDDFALLAVLA